MRKSFIIAAALLIGVVAVAVTLEMRREAAATTAKKLQQQTAAAAIPVLVAAAEAKDVPIILRGLGNVQAYNTVSMKSRVEGAVTKINFKEGQEVHTGDALIQLDARPFQAALAGARRCRQGNCPHRSSFR